MTVAEFESWREFYQRYPFDDYHRFYRPAALGFSSAFSPENRTGAVLDALDWLQPDRSEDELTDADMATMRAFGFTKKGG